MYVLYRNGSQFITTIYFIVWVSVWIKWDIITFLYFWNEMYQQVILLVLNTNLFSWKHTFFDSYHLLYCSGQICLQILKS